MLNELYITDEHDQPVGIPQLAEAYAGHLLKSSEPPGLWDFANWFHEFGFDEADGEHAEIWAQVLGPLREELSHLLTMKFIGGRRPGGSEMPEVERLRDCVSRVNIQRAAAVTCSGVGGVGCTCPTLDATPVTGSSCPLHGLPSCEL